MPNIPSSIIEEAWKPSKIKAYKEQINKEPYQPLPDLIATLWKLNSTPSLATQ